MSSLITQRGGAFLCKFYIKLFDSELALCYWNEVSRNRLIGLKEWKKKNLEFNTEEGNNYNDSCEVNKEYEKEPITIPIEIIKKLKFTSQSNIKPTFDDYVVYIIELGLKAAEEEIKEAFNKKIKEIYG